MIYKFEALKALFESVDDQLNEKVSIFIIGGAALLHYGLGKGYTKDIDIVFEDNIQFENYKSALYKLGFATARKPITHDKLDIFEMLENGEFRFDLFVKRVIKGFCLSRDMVKRSENILNLKFLRVYICSKEDIVIFKSLSPDRQNDIEDSIDLIKRGVEWNVIYQELQLQTHICGEKKHGKELVWYFIERMYDLEKQGIIVPIKEKVGNFYNTL